MSSLTGTWRLLRLALRRDRFKLPIVIIVLGFLFISIVAATVDVYSDPAQQLLYASTSAPSVVARIFGGPLNGANLGSIVMNESFLFTALAVAFMSTLTVVRHTRQNEEYGRSELIESGIVSRHASLAAALIVAVGANVVFGAITTLALIANDLPVDGAIGTGVAMGAIGITFATVAAVMAQLADSARGANSFSALAIGVAFLLRGIGDGFGTLSADGLAVKSAFPSWLSPFGWGQQVHPLTEQNWWIFGLFAGLTIALVVTAVTFMSKRDIGLGMIATRPGPAHAPRKLLSTFGLAARLQKGILRGWIAVILVLGVSYGAVIKEFEDIILENEQMAEAFAQYGDDVTKSFIGFMIAFMAVTIAGYAVQALLRMRSEEAGGQLESVLGTGVSRTRWMLSHISFAFMGVIILSILTALSMGITFILTSGESWSWLWTMTGAALVQSIAIFALAGFVIALYSAWPRMAVPLAWGGFAACILIIQMGTLLELPQWVLNISPFSHLPAIPAQSFQLAPAVWLSGASLSLLVLGLAWLNHRDITTT